MHTHNIYFISTEETIIHSSICRIDMNNLYMHNLALLKLKAKGSTYFKSNPVKSVMLAKEVKNKINRRTSLMFTHTKNLNIFINSKIALI